MVSRGEGVVAVYGPVAVVSQRSFNVVGRLGVSQSIKDKIRAKKDGSRLGDYFDSGSGPLGVPQVIKSRQQVVR
jgi:hypothetical protein